MTCDSGLAMTSREVMASPEFWVVGYWFSVISKSVRRGAAGQVAVGRACGDRKSSAQMSPWTSSRRAMVRRVIDCGPTAPLATSAHVHGAEMGALGFGRTAYAAAYVAPNSLRPVSTRIR